MRCQRVRCFGFLHYGVITGQFVREWNDNPQAIAFFRRLLEFVLYVFLFAAVVTAFLPRSAHIYR